MRRDSDKDNLRSESLGTTESLSFDSEESDEVLFACLCSRRCEECRQIHSDFYWVWSVWLSAIVMPMQEEPLDQIRSRSSVGASNLTLIRHRHVLSCHMRMHSYPQRSANSRM